MSTRSITHIHEMYELDAEQSIVCSFYRHSDGYPDGHGKDLSTWLNGKNLVNGIRYDFRKGIDFNRAGTMAVKLMEHIQNEDRCEVIPTGSSNIWEEYTYHIYFEHGEFLIETISEHNQSRVKVTAREYDPEQVRKKLDED